MNLRKKVILSVFKRNFASYFAGVLGYLFIIVFVVAGGALAFNARFFTANEPSLDQLTEWYPLLLLFIIPAITMTVWADERKSGTDEILFTLPATDLEILLGKYLSVLAVYSVALFFSTCHVLVLMFLGNPDWGLISTTYFGYWLAGAALLSAGMLASVLTSSTTVGFVLGVLICGIPVFVHQIGQFLGFGSLLEGLSLREQFRDFGMGIIPLSGLAYFVSFTALMLYLNVVLIRKRHWKSHQRSNMRLQFSTRAVCLAIMFCCATAWAGYAALRVDATSEKLFSLSSATSKILRDLDAERPIEIQAFLSPEMPREYVETRKQLVGLLRQFDELGGNKLEVRYVDVEPFSEHAEEAEHFGIEPVQVMTERDGRRSEVDVYLGAVVISSDDWSLDGLDSDTQETNKDAIRETVNAIADLKIAGVRPKQQGLTPDLKLDRSKLSSQKDVDRLQTDLLTRGFLLQPSQNGDDSLRLIAREGELYAATDEGLVHRMHFGRVFTGSQEELEIGLTSGDDETVEQTVSAAGDEGAEETSSTAYEDADEDEAAGTETEDGATDAPQEDADDKDSKDSSKPGRYVFVRVDFDKRHLGDEPDEPIEPEKPAELTEAESECIRVQI